jgi:hypothetical protein
MVIRRGAPGLMTHVLHRAVDSRRLLLSEAIRKLSRTVVHLSSSLLAVMKFRATAWIESVQPQMDVTNLDHRRTGFGASLTVLAVSTVPTMPGVRSRDHPAFLQRREALRSRRTHLHFDSPSSSIHGYLCFEVVIVILLIRKNRDETRKVLRIDLSEHFRCSNAIIQACIRHHDGHQEAQHIDQQMLLAPLNFLAAIVPALGSSDLGGLDRWAIDAGGTG